MAGLRTDSALALCAAQRAAVQTLLAGDDCLMKRLSKEENMKQPLLAQTDIREDLREKYLGSLKFQKDLILQNLQRGRLLAAVIIGFETVFLLVDVIAALFAVDPSFSSAAYLAMYCLMIALNLLYLLLIRGYNQRKIRLSTMNAYIVLYVVLVMTWGSGISLMDQKLYGHLMSFMVNMMVCSILYLADARRMSVPYLVSTLMLVIGLPFFQSSRNVLIGHLVNLLVFVVISWTASRIVYRNYCDNYVIKALMNHSKSLLEREMEENRRMYRKLAAANAQLKKLALLDELTGLPNRRSFREFIFRMREAGCSDLDVSVIMIDIDHFKQYNDCYGHKKGDLALIAVARQIDSIVESTGQIAVRWGGEEFIYTALHKSRERILALAERLRLKISELRIPTGGSSTGPYITISLGVCSGRIADLEDIDKIVNTADRALYLAKNGGRNRVAFLPCDEASAPASREDEVGCGASL